MSTASLCALHAALGEELLNECGLCTRGDVLLSLIGACTGGAEVVFCFCFFTVRAFSVPVCTGKRSLERRLGDLRLARVRQATNPRIPDDFLAIEN